jgi:hypothetical protein
MAIELDHDTPSEAPAQVGGPKRQHVEEAKLRSGGPTSKCPHMVVSR